MTDLATLLVYVMVLHFFDQNWQEHVTPATGRTPDSEVPTQKNEASPFDRLDCATVQSNSVVSANRYDGNDGQSFLLVRILMVNSIMTAKSNDSSGAEKCKKKKKKE